MADSEGAEDPSSVSRSGYGSGNVPVQSGVRFRTGVQGATEIPASGTELADGRYGYSARCFHMKYNRGFGIGPLIANSRKTEDEPEIFHTATQTQSRQCRDWPEMTMTPATDIPTVTEEILVLLLDDERGVPVPVPRSHMACVFAGAVLMDLAFVNRIDTDLESLMVIDRTPTGIFMLDHALAKIVARKETADARAWIRVLSSEDSAMISEQAHIRLVERGILTLREGSFRAAFWRPRRVPARLETEFAWPFGRRRYRESIGRIKLRIGNILFSDDIPDPHEVALIGLVSACNLFGEIYPDRDIGQFRTRIDQLSRMDLIGRELAGMITEIGHGVQESLAGADSRTE